MERGSIRIFNARKQRTKNPKPLEIPVALRRERNREGERKERKREKKGEGRNGEDNGPSTSCGKYGTGP